MKPTPDLWHKYTADYELITVKDKKGRDVKEARYIGSYFHVKGSPGAIRTKLFLTLACGIILTALLVFIQLDTHVTAWTAYVAVPQTVALFPLLYLLMGLTSLPYKLKPMERPFYMHGIIRICRCAVAILVLCGVSFAGDFIYRAFTKDWFFRPEDIRYLIILGGILLLAVAILVLLNSIEITERHNPAVSKE